MGNIESLCVDAPISRPQNQFGIQSDAVEADAGIRNFSRVQGSPPDEFLDREECQPPPVPQPVRNSLLLRTHSSLVQTNSEHCTYDERYFKLKRSGNIYNGQWKEQRPHGQGTMYYLRGNVYRGAFIEGLPFGFGKLIMPSGDQFEGELQFGRANGFGVYNDGSYSYRGGFKDDHKHGQGEEKDANNYFFKGEFENGERVKGLLKYGGNAYEGEFEGNSFEGNGFLKTEDGDEYRGRFKGGLFDGYGEYKWKDGSVYRGFYTRGEREGDGEFSNSKDSSLSKGIWRQGVLHGEGSYRDGRLRETVCAWVNGKMEGLSTIR